MEQILTEEHNGIPNLKRTENSLNNGDKLWEGAKEKMIGERGINDAIK